MANFEVIDDSDTDIPKSAEHLAEDEEKRKQNEYLQKYNDELDYILKSLLMKGNLSYILLKSFSILGYSDAPRMNLEIRHISDSKNFKIKLFKNE